MNTFNDFTASRKHYDDLRDYPDYYADERIAGWIYLDSFVIEFNPSDPERCFNVVIANTEQGFANIQSAERYLWGQFARDECNA